MCYTISDTIERVIFVTWVTALVESYPLIVFSVLFILIYGLVFAVDRLIIRTRLSKQMRVYKKKRAKKMHGEELAEKLKFRRKKHEYNFKYLKKRSKNKVDVYLAYKHTELYHCAQYLKVKRFKRPKVTLAYTLKDGDKTIRTFKHKHLVKTTKRLMKDYPCIDRALFFLHHLPDQLLQNKDFMVNLTDEVTITYGLK